MRLSEHHVQGRLSPDFFVNSVNPSKGYIVSANQASIDANSDIGYLLGNKNNISEINCLFF